MRSVLGNITAHEIILRCALVPSNQTKSSFPKSLFVFYFFIFLFLSRLIAWNVFSFAQIFVSKTWHHISCIFLSNASPLKGVILYAGDNLIRKHQRTSSQVADIKNILMVTYAKSIFQRWVFLPTLLEDTAFAIYASLIVKRGYELP